MTRNRQRGSDPDPVALSDALHRVAESLGGPSSQKTAAVVAGWPDIVGDRIASHARPVVLRDKVLVVEVDEPGWATELRYLRGELVSRLQASLGNDVIERIELRAGRTS